MLSSMFILPFLPVQPYPFTLPFHPSRVPFTVGLAVAVGEEGRRGRGRDT